MIEHVTNRPSRDRQKCTASETTEEADNQHGLEILGHRTRNEPDGEEDVRDDIDGTTTIEFRQGTQQHRSDPEAKDESRQSDGRLELGRPKFGVHLTCARTVSQSIDLEAVSLLVYTDRR